MDLLDLFVKIGVKDEASDKVSSIGGKLKSGLATAGKVAAAGVGLVTAAAGAAAGALSALEGATEEYRVAQGKLNSAFEAAGSDADTAAYAYGEFYKILGDTDTATEASQLLSKLTTDGEDIAYWTHIAAGVFGEFGDSLPIEGLIEASNETAKTAQVTGVLADALNWVGISEDEVNAKLASMSDETERADYLMNLLMDTYDGSADAFWKNNEALTAAREAQTKWMDALSKLATTVQTVKTGLISDFLPSVVSVADALNGMLTGTEGASEQFATAVEGLVAVAVEKLPQFLDFGVQIIMALVNGIVASLPSLVAAVPQIVTAIASALVGLLPQILSVGMQLLDQLATGIETGLPNMVDRLPQVIDAILGFITENLPAFLEKGVELLSKFAFGIIDSIPVLVSKLPQVIRSITEFFEKNFPLIVKSGGQLLGRLLVGILGAIPEIAVQLPAVVSAIVDALQAGWDQLKQAGAYLLEGLWAGIGDKIEWLKSKVSGVVDTIKSWFTGSEGFDEHSPSRWSRQVFRYIMDGGAQGLDDGLRNVMSTVRSVGNTIKSGMDFGTASVDFASSGLGISSAGIINSMTQSGVTSGGAYTFNLMLPGGEKLVSYVFSPMVNYAKANGTPILNPT